MNRVFPVNGGITVLTKDDNHVIDLCDNETNINELEQLISNSHNHYKVNIGKFRINNKFLYNTFKFIRSSYETVPLSYEISKNPTH